MTLTGKASTYTVTLDKCSATNTPSSSATATYYATTLSSITLPTRSHTISGFTIPSGNNASGATVSSTATLTSTYTFNGWYIGSCASPGKKVASNAATPALQASVSGYTDSSKRWIKDGTATLYAGWTGQAKTLPTITKTGYICGWTTTSTGATTIMYASGASMTPTGNTTLYGVCVANTYTITLNSCNATNSPSSSTTATYNATTLSSITTPTRSYTVSGFTTPSGNNANGATVSNTTTRTSTYSFVGWYTSYCLLPQTKIASNVATPALQSSVSGYTDSSSRWIKDGKETLYARWENGAITLPTITKSGYTCGWTDVSSNAKSIKYASGATIKPESNMVLYGVCGVQSYLYWVNIPNSYSSGNVPSTTYTSLASFTAAVNKPFAVKTEVLNGNVGDHVSICYINNSRELCFRNDYFDTDLIVTKEKFMADYLNVFGTNNYTCRYMSSYIYCETGTADIEIDTDYVQISTPKQGNYNFCKLSSSGYVSCDYDTTFH